MCLAASGFPLDSDTDRGYTASWRSSRPDSPKEVIFSAPSQLADDMRVEVVERAQGWRTLNLAGTKRNIMHGLAKILPDGGADGSAMPTEYLKSLAALALAGLECDDGAVTSPKCLFLGLGAGSLPRFIDTHVPGAVCVALELDNAVCEAAQLHLGLRHTNVTVIVDDGVEWVATQARSATPPRFDAIFIDIFDSQNNCPPEAFSDSFLASMRGLLQPGGVVVHNLHYGSKRLNATLREAESSYARAFQNACRAFAADANPWAGNAIIAASPSANVYSCELRLREAAVLAGKRHHLLFDAARRCEGAEGLRANSTAAPLLPEVAMAEMATPRFAANIAEARRLRESLPLAEAGAALASVGLLKETVLHGWGAPTKHLAASLTLVLGLRGQLETLHSELPAFSSDRESHKRITKAKIQLQRPLADESIAAEFHSIYDSFICEHVAPHVALACAGPSSPNLLRTSDGEDTLWYACTPTIRVQTPSEEHATIRPHVDGMYELPDGSINFWMPLTPLESSSTLWVESVPGLENFHPLTGATRFDGRRCLHFTLPNHSSRTRVSLDFRCVPGALHEPSGRLAQAGYFSAVVREASASGNGMFIPKCRGETSMLHGLPHTSTPPGWQIKRTRKPKKPGAPR